MIKIQINVYFEMLTNERSMSDYLFLERYKEVLYMNRVRMTLQESGY